MGRESAFEHKAIIQLPLPVPKDGETEEDVVKKGLKVGVELLQDTKVMINYDNKSISHESIPSTHPTAVNVFKMASNFEVHLRAADHSQSLSSEWNHFIVTEGIPILGMTKTMSFPTALRFNEDGMEALSDAGSSVTVYGKYVLTKSETDHRCLQFTETTYMECSKLLSWYVKSTMIKAHDRVNAYYKEKFVERMSGKNWS